VETIFRVTENISGRMEENTMVNGSIIKCMERVNLHGLI
jgi:hypothetical protein